MKNEWENKAEETLNSLAGLQRASANPYLFTRIMARIEEQQNKWSLLANFISRPVIALSVTCFFVAINTWMIVKHPLKSQVAKPVTEVEQTLEPEYANVNYSLGEVNTTEK
jgi:Na+/proline symporter